MQLSSEVKCNSTIYIDIIYAYVQYTRSVESHQSDLVTLAQQGEWRLGQHTAFQKSRILCHQCVFPKILAGSDMQKDPNSDVGNNENVHNKTFMHPITH